MVYFVLCLFFAVFAGVDCWVLFVIRGCVLFVGLFVVCCLLFIVCLLIAVACCLLSGVMFVVCNVMSVVW